MDVPNLAEKVAALYLARLKKAREGEIASNPVIENMGNSEFVSEGFIDKDKPEETGPDKEGEPVKAPHEKPKAQP
jgi:hypothetical protein